ncbi:MAG: RimK/LysX family protein [Candidatus Woesearchaeota archaeon]
MDFSKRTLVGLTERMVVKSHDCRQEKLIARIDTGATKSSIDLRLARQLGLGPVLHTRSFRSANGNSVRPIVKASIVIAGRKMKVKFSVVDRRHMRYRLLIGQNVLKRGFLIDPLRK